MKTVHELSQNELEELRESYFDQLQMEGEETFESVEQLPIENVIAHYEDTFFVEEDFFCNL